MTLSTPEPISIFWKGHLIGHIHNMDNDMWYQGGKWIGDNSEEAHSFEKILMQLGTVQQWKEIQENLKREIWIGVGQNRPTHLVFSYFEDRIDMKLVVNAPENWSE